MSKDFKTIFWALVLAIAIGNGLLSCTESTSGGTDSGPDAASDTGDVDDVCEPGSSQSCVCADEAGTQSCLEDGTGWESCVCDDPVPPCLEVDVDGDGFIDRACGGDDCNDNDASIFPGAVEDCSDGIDQNCSGFDGDPGDAVMLMDPIVLVDRLTRGGNFYTQLHWTGSEYSLIWRQFGGDGIYLIRLDALGNLIGEEVRIREFLSAFDTVWNGGGYGTAWSTGNIYFQLLDENGAQLGDEIEIASSGYALLDGSVSYGPRLFWTGESYLLIWGDSGEGDTPSGLYFVRLDESGHRQTENTRVGGAGGPIEGELGADDLGLAWSVNDWGGWSFARVGLDGELRTDRSPISSEGWPEYADTRVLWTGSGYSVAWVSNERDSIRARTIFLQRLSEAGALFGDPFVVSRCDADIANGGEVDHSMNAVSMGSAVALLWRDRCETEQRHLFNVVTDEGETIGEPLTIATGIGQRSAALAWTGEHIGVSWASSSEGDQRIYFSRIGFCE